MAVVIRHMAFANKGLLSGRELQEWTARAYRFFRHPSHRHVPSFLWTGVCVCVTDKQGFAWPPLLTRSHHITSHIPQAQHVAFLHVR
jgi:hypothetical protein